MRIGSGGEVRRIPHLRTARMASMGYTSGGIAIHTVQGLLGLVIMPLLDRATGRSTARGPDRRTRRIPHAGRLQPCRGDPMRGTAFRRRCGPFQVGRVGEAARRSRRRLRHRLLGSARTGRERGRCAPMKDIRNVSTRQGDSGGHLGGTGERREATKSISARIGMAGRDLDRPRLADLERGCVLTNEPNHLLTKGAGASDSCGQPGIGIDRRSGARCSLTGTNRLSLWQKATREI